MSRLIQCSKLAKEAEGLAFPPYPGELGKRIYLEISAQAWDMWKNHQTILINEYRLNLTDPKARAYLATEMEKFLFGDGSEVPEAFRPPTAE